MQRQDASCKDRRVLAKLTFATAKAIAMVGDDALDDGALQVRRIANRLRVRLHPPVQALDWEGVVDAAIAHKLCCDSTGQAGTVRNSTSGPSPQSTAAPIPRSNTSKFRATRLATLGRLAAS